jgi:two-component system chemotaxis response regulator CheY
MKILIVDDDMVSRLKLQVILDQIGEVTLAENGEEALETFKTAWKSFAPFDLVCLDIEMPGKGGMETLYDIRSLERTMNVDKEKPAVILMVTSHSDKDNVVTSIQAGCNGYLLKPFDSDSVMKMIKEAGFSVKVN